MEIYGILPFPESILNSNENGYTVKLIRDSFTITGMTTKESTEDEYVFSCVISAKLYVLDNVPSGDDEADTSTTYDKAIFTSSGVTVKTNTGLDVKSISDMTLVDYTSGTSFTVSYDNLSTDDTNRVTIINYLKDSQEEFDIPALIKKILEDIDNMPSLDLASGDIYDLTNGALGTETTTNSLGQQVDTTRWLGTKPLDMMIKVFATNLDLLVEEDKLKGDQYAAYYTQLMQTALQLACDLEKNRWTLAIQGASQLIQAKIAAMKAITEWALNDSKVALTNMQIKTTNAQFKGFAANNKQKVFASQIDGSTMAYSAGMTENAPAILNNAELMETYTAVKSDMDDII